MIVQRIFISIFLFIIPFWLFSQKRNLTLYWDKEKTILKESYQVQDSALNGQYIQYYKDGTVKVRGFYVNNVASGIWEYYYPDGNPKMRGELRKNKNFGMWEYFYENGNKSMEGSIFGGKRQGNWNFYYPEGSRKSHGEFVNDNKSGKWVTYYPTGELKSEAEYKIDKGTYVEYYKTGERKIEGLMLNGKNHGLWIFYYQDGTVQANGAYENGLKNGYWRYMYQNGQVSTEGNYIDGKQEGEWTYYHQSGAISSRGNLHDGKRDGYWSLFDDSGILIGDGDFVMGEGIYREYHGNGKLKAEGKLIDGKKYGKWKYYYNSGELEGESIFENNKGRYVGYFKDGGKKMAGKIESDQKVGIWELYNRDGTLAGYYKPIDNEDQPDLEISDRVKKQRKPGKMAERRIPDYLFKKKKFHPFTPRLNEFKGFVLAYNPFATLLDNFPISAEIYAQERLGHDLQFNLIRDPFFSKDNHINLNENYVRGFAIALKQKFYLKQNGAGSFYFGHELRYSNLKHSANVTDPNQPLPVVVNADEMKYEYSIIIGRRYFKNTNDSGITVDVFTGVGTGFRDFRPQFPQQYEPVFEEIRTAKVPFAFRLGINIGYIIKISRR